MIPIKFSRGQAVSEYVMLISGAMIIVLVMLVIQSNMSQDANQLELQADAARVASKISLAISHAYAAGDGTQLFIYNFGNPKFNITIQGRTIKVDYNSSYWSTNAVTNRTLPSNPSINKWLNITNKGGWIYVIDAQ
ncbi:Uncharacterised protein [Candidatus Anstonella stagnisolia]|nr:Uncharacterised protein [Candidatus Anstonella stagnisolia]